jgi:hypothetical protein
MNNEQNIKYPHNQQLNIAVVIPRFSVNDKVKTLIGKNAPDKIYRAQRKGSVGIIEKIGSSLNKICYWVNFGNHNSWVNEDELNVV